MWGGGYEVCGGGGACGGGGVSVCVGVCVCLFCEFTGGTLWEQIYV